MLRMILLALFLLLPYSSGASAQYPCTDRTVVVELLDEKYKEHQTAVGILDSRGLLEVFVSEDGTWSIIISSPRGISCLMFTGEDWKDIKHLVKDPKA